MVSWENIVSVISNNPFKSSSLATIVLPSEGACQRFPIQKQSGAAAPSLSVVPAPSHSAAPAPAPAPAPASSPVCEEPAPKKRNGKEIDPITIDMLDTIQLYDSSSWPARKQLECEEAMRIEKTLGDLYKSQSGRSRGWTKVGLEGLIQARCASGGDIKELDKSKKAFLWPLVADDKVYSSFLDFVCLAKNIRVAVWFETEKHVILFPAADMASLAQEPPLYNITMNGVLISNGIKNGSELIQYCDKHQITLMPPASIFHTLSTLTMSELESIATKLGIDNIEGNKKERVAKLARFKLRDRLLSKN